MRILYLIIDVILLKEASIKILVNLTIKIIFFQRMQLNRYYLLLAIIKCNKNDKLKTKIMNISIILFIIGILGFVLNRKNIILMIIAIEIMLLAVTLLVLIMSYSFDDNIGQIFSLYILSIAGAESVIGLSILVAYYRLRGTISLNN